MACGLPLLNPTFPDFAKENRTAFLHPPLEYDPRDPATLRELLWCTQKLELHAKHCLQEVLARHTLDAKLRTLIQQTFQP
jgi:alkylhydroperoxidase/carboxymuconolactone decarboxylase family protein YurZ